MKSLAADPFYQLSRNPHPDLVQGALLIAASVYANLDLDYYRTRLAGLGTELAKRQTTTLSPHRTLQQINAFLFAELGFRACNHADYYHPRNSYLNDVLDRRVGIPITLSLVYMEVAHQLGLKLTGVNYPGHFLLCCHAENNLYVDAFAGGKVYDRSELLSHPNQTNTPSAKSYLAEASTREILARMLRNLRPIYLRCGDLQLALHASERIILLLPDAAQEYRELGTLYFRLGQFDQARAALHIWRDQLTDSEDRRQATVALEAVARARRSNLN